MGSNRPSGAVTFLFTDIEGSTQLWERHPEGMKTALAEHDRLLRRTFEAHNGYVFKTVGDAFCVAFTSPTDALRAALEAQTGLFSAAWGDTPIRVRMGLNTGETQERDGDYFGQPLNRAARLMSAGHGGQTLLSSATAELVRPQLPSGIELRDMGERRLKDLIQPEHIYQLCTPDLPTQFPALKTLETFRTNLPAQLTSFVGREKEIAEVKQTVTGNRLTTLTGSGGTGKTRLSLQAAANLFNEFPDGIWLVELAPLTDPELVLKTVAATLGLREEADKTLLELLIGYLRTKNVLLIFDNCEHLIEASAQLIAGLLGACPQLTVMASSREVLSIPGEAAYRVPPLALPAIGQAVTAEALVNYEAVQLFVDRARAALPAFKLAEDNAPAVLQLCQRLDGIPLAIELAAARVNLLRPEQIVARLNDSFRLLTGSSRTRLPRQQTLRAAIDWSYGLLNDQERGLLRRLAVFVGGWTIEAAETVCADRQLETTATADTVLDLLTSLVNKSLVVVEREHSQQARFRLLETVRQYAREKLAESGEADTLRDQHLAYFLALGERAEPELQGAEQFTWFEQISLELDNIRAALEWSLENGERGAEAGLRLASSLWWYWFQRGGQGTELWLERALSAAKVSASPIHRAMALARSLWVNFGGENHGPRADESLALGRSLQREGRECVALTLLIQGAWALYQAEYAQAILATEKSLALFRELRHRWGICESLTWKGLALISQGNSLAAMPPLEESLALARKAQDGNEIGFALWQLGRAATAQEDYGPAIAYMTESLATFRALRQFVGVTFVLGDLGKAALEQRNYEQATLYYKEALNIYWESAGHLKVAEGLEQLANTAVQAHRLDYAARLYGAAQAVRKTGKADLFPYQLDDYRRSLELLRSQLDQPTFDTCWFEGEAMPIKQAVAYALESGG